MDLLDAHRPWGQKVPKPQPLTVTIGQHSSALICITLVVLLL
jgi:hypothetical protein